MQFSLPSSSPSTITASGDVCGHDLDCLDCLQPAGGSPGDTRSEGGRPRNREPAIASVGWESSYPSWWWKCDHPENDKDCMYCWKRHTSQPFASQYNFYVNSRQQKQRNGSHTPVSVDGRELPPLSQNLQQHRSGAGLGGSLYMQYPQGMSYTLPARYESSRSVSNSNTTPRSRKPIYHPPAGYRYSHPGYSVGGYDPDYMRHHVQLTDPYADDQTNYYQGMRPAGAPSVRRSHSMTLHDMANEVGGGGVAVGRSRLLDSRQHDNIGSSHSDYGGRESSMSDGQDSEFVVQRARGVSTLSDMIRSNRDNSDAHHRSVGGGGSSVAGSDGHEASNWYEARNRRHQDDDTRSRISQEDDDSAIKMYRRDSQYGSVQDLQQTEKLPPAGMPSRYEHRPQGRSRSRRNSISAEESQLTVENFGGSQDNLNDYITRNNDKEPMHIGRRDSNSRPTQHQIDNRVLDKLEREAIEREKREFMFGSKNAIFAEDPPSYEPPPPPSHQQQKQQQQHHYQQQNSDSDSDLSSEKEKLSKATSFAELSKAKEPTSSINISYMAGEDKKATPRNIDKKTSFAALPNQTTWKQQIVQSQPDEKSVGDENMEPQVMASELHNVRLKLEEKRRRIESEKRKMELMLNKQRQKMGKDVFMQAVVKGDIGSDVSQVSRKWLEGGGGGDGELRTPDMDNMEYDQYQHSLSQDEDEDAESMAMLRRRESIGLDLAGAPLPPRPLPRDVDPRRLSLYLPPTHASYHHHTPPPPTALPPYSSTSRHASSYSVVSPQYRRFPPVRSGGSQPPFASPSSDALPHYHDRMTDSLSEIQGDLQRLSSQQQQIQGMIRGGHNQQFYLHDQVGESPSGSGRRMWGDAGPAMGSGDPYNSPASRRAQWGPVRPPHEYYQHGGYYGPPGGYQQLPPLHPQQGGFVLHQHHSLPPQQGGAPHMYPQQNGQQQGYYGSPMAAQDPQYRGGYSPYQYPPHQDPRSASGPAPFRLHSDAPDDSSTSSRGPASLRSSAQNSPSRQPLQHQNYNYPPQPYSNHGAHPQPYSPQYSQSQSPYSQGYANQNNQQQPQQNRQSVSPGRSIKPDGSSVLHAPVAAPPPDDMEPQNVSFIDTSQSGGSASERASQERERPSTLPQQQRSSINSSSNNVNNRGRSGHADSGDGEDDSPTAERLKRLSIGSGSRTYRILGDGSSPTRPTVGTKTFRVPTKRGTPVYDDSEIPQPAAHQRSLSPLYQPEKDDPATSNDELVADIKTEPLNDCAKPEKGFYISFDGDVPTKPKPLLRPKKFTRKSSTPATPAPTPCNEDFSVISDSNTTPLRNSRFPSNASLDLTPTSNLRRPSSTYSPASPTSPSVPYSSSMARSPFSPSLRSLSNSGSLRANGFSFGGKGGSGGEEVSADSTGESCSGEELPVTEVNKGSSTALVIGDEALNEESAFSDMERKKQRLMILSMKRKQQQEEMKRAKELEAEQRREREKDVEERKLRKKEEEKQRREMILERHRIKKAIEEAEKEGTYYQPPAWYVLEQANTQPARAATVRMRSKPGSGGRPRPKTMYEGDVADGERGTPLAAARRNRGSTQNMAGPPETGGMRKSSGRWGSSHSLSRAAGARGSTNSLSGDYGTSSRTLERRGGARRPTSVVGGNSLQRHQSSKSLYGSRNYLPYNNNEETSEYRVHSAARRPGMNADGSGSNLRRPSGPSYRGAGAGGSRRYRSTGNLSGSLRKRSASEHDSLMYGMSEDSGLGRATPPRRAASPGMGGGVAGGSTRHLPSPSQPGSLPPGLITRRRPTIGGGFDDAASDISTTSSTMDFTGPRLFKQPTSKSNRGIVLNAVEFCVFPGAVNQNSKHRVLEEIARSEAKHFLFLFRDTNCQFRGLYSYNPDSEEVDKIHGTGPKRVTDNMFDKFFKYNSGAKNFSPVHTKHLTATIDAFTIQNSLWQGKRVSLPSKKDYALVI
ncbi:CKK domain [Trinorchestia longiramus]|nr:CKK domain [Trinorchestia longiramus]